ncbi:MAG TPA: condensation domain-containing protein, partial [Herpetosiphonaceae bacterium]
MSDLQHRIADLSPERRKLLELLYRQQTREDQARIPQLPRTSGVNSFPLSFAQQRLWFIDQLQPGSATYNLLSALRLTGPLDAAALSQALNVVVQRHETLRTTFIQGAADEQPLQVVAPTLTLTLPISDLTGVELREREAAIQRWMLDEARRPFDLACGPLLRARLLRLGAQDHRLIVVLHHIIADGWSQGVLVRELTSLYAAFSQGRPSPLAPLPIQYADFAVWQRQRLRDKALAVHLDYWKRQLADLPKLLLPTDYPRTAIQTITGARQIHLLPPSLMDALKALSQREGATLFQTLLTALQVLLQRYTGQNDIAVGSAIASRNRAEVEPLIGFFVNTLVLRANLAGNPTFRDTLRQVRETTLAAYAHQDLPFEKLVEVLQPERDLSTRPLTQVFFVLQNTPRPALSVPPLTIELMETEHVTAAQDLALSIVETPQGLRIRSQYNADLFAAETITRIMGHFHTLLAALVANPDERIAELPLLTEAERQQMLIDWNRSEAEYPRDAAVHQLFEAQAARTPHTRAIVFDGQALSYAELNTRANQLAHYLRAQGVGPDVLVALCVERSLEMIVGMLAILKAGGAYLPLDPTYPAERLQYMLSHSRAPVLLTQAALVERLPEHQARVFRLDADWPLLSEQPTSNPARTALPEHLAYLIFTSGSTGKPKGVMVTQRGLINLVFGLRAYFADPAVQTTGLITSISFDISVNQIFPTLFFGRTLHIIPDAVKFDSRALLRYLHEQQVHLLDAVPSYMQTVLNEVAPEQPPNALRYLLIGGEKIEQRLLQSVCGQLGPQVQVVNIYGLTEISDINILGVLRADDLGKPVTVGTPLQNNR